jgi:NhaP-type Na+/H+ and K+/H+ antiporter
MEALVETIDLDMEESNELAFRIRMEGIENNPVKVRLVCESRDISYMFNGYSGHENDVVHFILPEMKNKIQEGIYQSRVEVLVDNRYFSPVNFQINFKKAMKVVAESVQIQHRNAKPEIKITAQPIVVKQLNTQEQVQTPVKQTVKNPSSLSEIIARPVVAKSKEEHDNLRDATKNYLKPRR